MRPVPPQENHEHDGDEERFVSFRLTTEEHTAGTRTGGNKKKVDGKQAVDSLVHNKKNLCRSQHSPKSIVHSSIARPSQWKSIVAAKEGVEFFQSTYDTPARPFHFVVHAFPIVVSGTPGVLRLEPGLAPCLGKFCHATNSRQAGYARVKCRFKGCGEDSGNS